MRQSVSDFEISPRFSKKHFRVSPNCRLSFAFQQHASKRTRALLLSSHGTDSQRASKVGLLKRGRLRQTVESGTIALKDLYLEADLIGQKRTWVENLKVSGLLPPNPPPQIRHHKTGVEGIHSLRHKTGHGATDCLLELRRKMGNLRGHGWGIEERKGRTRRASSSIYEQSSPTRRAEMRKAGL